MKCIISGCDNSAKNHFGVRLRRPETTAIWAPNTHAYLCDDHAADGMKIKVILEPTQTKKIETEVSSLSRHAVTRTTPIKKIP